MYLLYKGFIPFLFLLLFYQIFPHFYSMFSTTVYKILSFILLPIGAFLGIVCLCALIPAFGNISMLLPVFLVACIAIYIFSSFTLVFNGMIKEKLCNPSLKDWIKVNAYVSLFFAIMCVSNFVYLKTKPELMKEFTKEVLATQKNIPAEAIAMMPQIINGMLSGMLALGIILLIHISLSLTFIKTKPHLFKEEE